MTDYLHRCLALHAEVAKARYGKVQRLEIVERDVRQVLAGGGELWDAIVTLHEHRDFDAGVFGPLPKGELERALKKRDWYGRWRELRTHGLVGGLFSVYRQIEPVSMLLRFAMPDCYGIYSAPVANLLGIRPLRRQTATYSAYLKSLQKLRDARGFERVADVEMALWALQLGVLERRLKGENRDAPERAYKRDTKLRQMQVANLTKQLFSERPRIELAEALLAIDVRLAGQIAGIEFEQFVRKWTGVDVAASLEEAINRAPGDRGRLHRARRTRNRAIHPRPRAVRAHEVAHLIGAAKWVKDQLPRGGSR